MRAEDSQVIDPLALASSVEPGMILEMIIVLRRGTIDEKKCPRCGNVGSDIVSNKGWMDWQVLLTFYAL